MCRKKPGIRCSGSTGKCLDDINASLAHTTARAVEIEAEMQEATTEEEATALMAELDRVETEGQLLEARKKGAQDAYDMTRRGREELQAAMTDESLTPLEHKRLKARYDKAVAGWEGQRKRRDLNDVASENTTLVLRQFGVDEETIADITADINNEQGIPHPRSIADYKAQLVTAQAKYDAINTKAKLAAKDAKDKALDSGLSDEQVEQAVQKAKAKHAEAWKKAKRRVDEVKFAIDSTEEGQKALREQIAACTPEDFEKRASLKFRLGAVAKSRADGLSARRNRQLYKDKIKAAMKSVGRDPGVALKALASPDRLHNEPKLHPHELRTNVRSHFAPADQEKMLNDFRRSREYKANGEQAFNTYALRKIMADPRAGLTAGAVSEANAKAEIGFDNRPHRHFTTSAGARQARTDVHLTQGEVEIIKDRASSLQMSVSSYVNALMLGKSPFAIQNDRSKENWKKKRNAVNQMLAQMQAAA